LDKAHFQEVIGRLQREAKAGESPMLLIADSALFTEEEIDETVPDHEGRPTQKPTLRWIFQCFEGITLLNLKLLDQPQQRQALNLNVLHKQIIAIFGGQTELIYSLAFSP
jgi:hypothetical protein